MLEAQFQGFDEAERIAVTRFLNLVPRTILARGQNLADRGAVRRVWWEEPDHILCGTVKGGELYEQSIVIGPDIVEEAVCTCPYEYECKHTVALLSHLLTEWPLPTHDTASTPAATRNSKRAARQPPAPPSPNWSVQVSELEKHLASRLKRSLNAREKEQLKSIESLWTQGNRLITENHLLELGGHTLYFNHWQTSQLELWPAHRLPTSALQAFYYFAEALRERNKLPRTPIFSNLDWEMANPWLAPWKREKGIASWVKGLHDLSHFPTSPPPSVTFRLKLSMQGGQIEWKLPGSPQFVSIKPAALRAHAGAALHKHWRCDHPMDDQARRFLAAINPENGSSSFLEAGSKALDDTLTGLLRQPGFENAVVTPDGEPLPRESAPLQWTLEGPVTNPEVAAALDPTVFDPSLAADYIAVLRTADGQEAPPALASLKGWPCLHVTPHRVYEIPDPFPAAAGKPCRVSIPAAALETAEGVAALQTLHVPLPEHLASRVQSVVPQVSVRCQLSSTAMDSTEIFQMMAVATANGRVPDEFWNGWKWLPSDHPPADAITPSPSSAQPILTVDRSLMETASPWLAAADVQASELNPTKPTWLCRRLGAAALRDFPETFLSWIDQRPENLTVELDPTLDSLLHGRVSGTVRLETEESAVDWFDVRVALDVSEVELTQAEVRLLLKARGRWVRLPLKGWRRLDFSLTEQQQADLADLGLAASDLTGAEPQRIHVLQLAGAEKSGLLPAEHVAQVKRRAEELRTAVSPPVPAAVTATLRPYQIQGFHFLAYLSTNRFGGILADDMGLGKTLQALAWIAWLRDTSQLNGPVLVVCPKSVQDNWRAEVTRFCPDLQVDVWNRDTAGIFNDPAPAATDSKPRRKKSSDHRASHSLLIINYTQLRLHDAKLLPRTWAAVILDEAQFIKNPQSQTAKSAFALKAGHRLALSGTPIENRLLDLWSIMNFAMPGVLGSRAAFARNFNGKDDPLARRRLASRVRPFVLRRTKKEVARDLPDRIEKELVSDLEGPQAILYRAELKHARTTLLKAKTPAQLDKLRFNILTSLLRLRQICCHPALVGGASRNEESAKLSALLELLETLMSEGHKVLVFSQFVDMLDILRSRIEEHHWPYLILTGQTEDRGALVDRFQQSDGPAIFLISLKAGGFGLNLTAASYVVLFDPWWNPAVENQAIDRTHRIGQQQKVIAHRLLVRNTIEEKIRHLQKEKSALAGDILGEETFAKALTLDDFRFLLGDEPPTPNPSQ